MASIRVTDVSSLCGAVRLRSDSLNFSADSLLCTHKMKATSLIVSIKLHGATFQKTVRFISKLWELCRILLPSSVSNVAFGCRTGFCCGSCGTLSSHTFDPVITGGGKGTSAKL